MSSLVNPHGGGDLKPLLLDGDALAAEKERAASLHKVKVSSREAGYIFMMGIGGVLSMGCSIGQGITGSSTLALGSFLALVSIMLGCALALKVQYYKLVYEEEASFVKALVASLADLHLLPNGLRKLDKV